MALVVLLRGVNVGGHRTFRPTTLAEQLKHLGTFDRLFGVPVTTRNWNTVTAIARVLGQGAIRATDDRTLELLVNTQQHATAADERRA